MVNAIRIPVGKADDAAFDGKNLQQIVTRASTCYHEWAAPGFVLQDTLRGSAGIERIHTVNLYHCCGCVNSERAHISETATIYTVEHAEHSILQNVPAFVPVLKLAATKVLVDIT